MGQELQERRLGGVEIVDDEDEWQVGRQGLEEPARSPEQFGHREALGGEPDRGGDACDDIRSVRNTHLQERAELGQRGLGRILIVDAGGRPGHFGEGPERDSLAVWQAPAPEPPRRVAQSGGELGDQPRLADPSFTGDGHEARLPRVANGAECGVEHGQLSTAADQGEGVGTERSERPGARLRSPDAHQSVRDDGFRLALERQRFDGLDDDGFADQPVGDVTDKDLLATRSLLQPSRHVDGIPVGQALVCRCVPGGHDFARIDPGPVLERDAIGQFQIDVDPGEGLLHAMGCANGSERIVLARLRQPEDGHDRVADVLLDLPPMKREDTRHRTEVAVLDLVQCLGVDPLAECRRALQVAEEEGDRLAQVLGGELLSEDSSAISAQAEFRGVLLAAIGAGDGLHPPSLAAPREGTTRPPLGRGRTADRAVRPTRAGGRR